MLATFGKADALLCDPHPRWRDLVPGALVALRAQLAELPRDFFVDELSAGNFLRDWFLVRVGRAGGDCRCGCEEVATQHAKLARPNAPRPPTHLRASTAAYTTRPPPTLPPRA